MNRTTRVRTTLTIGTLVLLSALPAAAQQGGPHKGCAKETCNSSPGTKEQQPHRIWEELGLSADQKTKITVMHEKQMLNRKEHLGKMKDIRTKIAAELAKESPDRKLLSSYSTDLGNLARDASEKRIDHLGEIRTLLTKEQFSKFIELQKSRGPMKEKGGHQSGMGKGPHCNEGSDEIE